MFDRYLAPRSSSPSRWRRTGISVSIAAHVGVGGWLILAAFWNLERLSPNHSPVVEISMQGGTDPGENGGGGPPPPPLKRHAASKPHKLRLDETVQPPATPPASDDSDDSGDGGDEGDEHGSRDGTAGGQGNGKPGTGLGIGPPGDHCIGQCISKNTVEVPKCVGAECDPKPTVVRAEMIEGYRISGNSRIPAPDPVRLAMVRAGQSETRAVIKMCLDASGRVSELKQVRSTGYESYDELFLREMRDWRYRPYEVNGKKVPICTVVTFIYRIE